MALFFAGHTRTARQLACLRHCSLGWDESINLNRAFALTALTAALGRMCAGRSPGFLTYYCNLFPT